MKIIKMQNIEIVSVEARDEDALEEGLEQVVAALKNSVPIVIFAASCCYLGERNGAKKRLKRGLIGSNSELLVVSECGPKSLDDYRLLDEFGEALPSPLQPSVKIALYQYSVIDAHQELRHALSSKEPLISLRDIFGNALLNFLDLRDPILFSESYNKHDEAMHHADLMKYNAIFEKYLRG